MCGTGHNNTVRVNVRSVLALSNSLTPCEFAYSFVFGS